MVEIKDVENFWGKNLCGSRFTKQDSSKKEFLERSRNLRYEHHYHIPRELDKVWNIKKGINALEIGVGMGIDTQYLCELGFRTSGIDLTQVAVDATQARLKHYNLKADIRKGNAESLDFGDCSFDFVYSFGVLHHTPDTQKAIHEVRRVLKEGGVCLIMLYNKHSLNYLVHQMTKVSFDEGVKGERCPEEKAYTKKEIQNLFKDFSSVNIDIDYLFGAGWKWVNYCVPMFVKKRLGRLMGWHIMIRAVR